MSRAVLHLWRRENYAKCEISMSHGNIQANNVIRFKSLRIATPITLCARITETACNRSLLIKAPLCFRNRMTHQAKRLEHNSTWMHYYLRRDHGEYISETRTLFCFVPGYNVAISLIWKQLSGFIANTFFRSITSTSLHLFIFANHMIYPPHSSDTNISGPIK